MDRVFPIRKVLGVMALTYSAMTTGFTYDPDTFKPHPSIVQEPWLTGPLLAGAGVTVPRGHLNIEPYLYVNDAFAVYTHNWGTRDIPNIKSLNPVLVLTQGLARRLDLEAVIPYEVNYVRDITYSGLGDIYVMMGVQAIRSETWPNLRITLGEIFPSGQFNNLDVNRLGADAIGAGSYQTNVTANFQKSWLVRGNHTFRMRVNLSYVIPTDVHVDGFNVHTGLTPLTGTVNLGDRINAIAGFEYTITQRWVPALDIQYHYEQSSKFRGFHKFFNQERVEGSAGSSTSFSLAPAIEYNFSSYFGVIAGAWFTVAGRNANDFASAVVAINYYI